MHKEDTCKNWNEFVNAQKNKQSVKIIRFNDVI